RRAPYRAAERKASALYRCHRRSPGRACLDWTVASLAAAFADVVHNRACHARQYVWSAAISGPATACSRVTYSAPAAATTKPIMIAMHQHYHYGFVLVSIAVAILASYTALTLAVRIWSTSGWPARAWLLGGGLAMGIGIWAMH